MSKRTHGLLKILLTLCFSVCMIACIFSINVAGAAGTISIKDGASIRYDDKEGIRFSAFVPDEYFTDVATHTLKDGVTVGMYVALASISGDNLTDIDASTTGVKTVNPTVWKATSEKSGHQQYNVVIYNIPATDYDTAIYARAFITDTSITEGDQTSYTATVKRSIREVANATLAGDVLLDSEDVNKLSDTQVTTLNKYIADGAVALGDVTVKIRGGYAVWEAVENATAYIVKTESGTFKTTEPKFLLDGDREVSVVAYGDGTVGTYSAVATGARTEHSLTGNQIATFDDESYIEDLEAGNHTLENWDYTDTTGSYKNENHPGTYSHSFYSGNGSSQIETEPTFAEGIASFGLGVTSYNGVPTLRTSVFSVYLQNGLDLTNYAGIKIKLMFEKFSADPTDGVGDLTFKLAHPTTTAEATGTRRQHGYVEPNANNPYKGGSEISVTQGEWIEWYITNEELTTGDFYAEGDKKLVISFFTANTFAYSQTRTAYFQIDDISYFNIVAPTNVALDGTTLTWDAVDSATGYVIDVDGDEYTTTETSYDLSDILASYASVVDVKVKAVNSESGEESSYAVVSYDIATPTNVALSEAKVLTWDAVANATGYVIEVDGADPIETTATTYDLTSVLTASTTIKVRAKRNALYSDYSESVNFDASTASALMAFDSNDYAQYVGLGKNAAIPSIAADTTADYTVEYQNEVDGATNGALYALPTISRYVNAGGMRLAIFTITLPEALSGLADGTNDGISITLKFGSIVKGTSTSTISNTQYTLMLIKYGYTAIAADNEYNKSNLASNSLPSGTKYAYTDVTVGEFVTWKISKADLASLDYVDGVPTITFGVRIASTSTDKNIASGQYGWCVQTWLDELAYYKETPV